jgi:hypothetical protein
MFAVQTQHRSIQQQVHRKAWLSAPRAFTKSAAPQNVAFAASIDEIREESAKIALSSAQP